MINRLWLFLILMAFVGFLSQLFTGHYQIVDDLVDSIFAMSKLSFDIALGLVGILSLWLGLLNLGEKAGIVQALGNLVAPLMRALLPEIPKNHPALGHMTLNMAANVMGLDNAATPLGLKAMESLQSLNSEKDKASRAQTLFLVLNSSSLTLFPVTIFMYRAQLGSLSPTDVFIPILLATSASSLAGLLLCCVVLRLKWLQPIVGLYIGAILGLLGLIVWNFSQLTPDQVRVQSALWGNGLLIFAIFGLILGAAWQKVALFEEFVAGAKEGFALAIKILPYLLAMLFAIGLLRASGVLDFMMDGIRWLFERLHYDSRFVEALPTAFMKPLSGSGARALMLEAMKVHGVDSFVGHLVAVIQGSTETTFYVLAVYFGSVGVTRAKAAIVCALAADLIGISVAIWVSYLFFGE
ncbi:MAG: hypothetical protein COW84_11300 [Gammaproteobacteria bacterium CG22_combo_CG10-13_8_21_14_all_40_8]|nr:MAG: hypothetical protein COW84_11300 [Gammaproteobacteria bacterium CG22_combo_CG10-13_8_21_14_all_40_8]